MSETPSGTSEKALREFLSEAQEIVEALGRDLLELDQGRAQGKFDPSVVNDAFRAVHSLKGLAGLFGVARMTNLAHNLENLLDSIRMGRIELTPETLDVLFAAVEVFGRIIAETSEGTQSAGGDVEELTVKIDRLAQGRAATDNSPLGGYELDASVLSVLTEYEEHRLKENVRAGKRLLRVHAAFELLAIEGALAELQKRLKPLGEVITYLPSPEGADEQHIEMDIIIGTDATLEAVAAAIKETGAQVLEIPKRTAPRRARAADGPSEQTRGAALPAGSVSSKAPQPSGRGLSSSEEAAHTKVSAETVGGQPRPGGTPAREALPAIETQPPVPGARAPSPGSASGTAGPRVPAGGSSSAPSAPPGDDGGEGGDGERAQSLRSISQTVRVDIRKLDALMNIVGELQIVRAGIASILEKLKGDPSQLETARELYRESRALERKVAELQSGILEVRMVPLGQVFDKLSRVVRKISRESQKEIRFVVRGAETELDKLIVEELSDPLMHIIRNSIDHGIEPGPVRVAAGKPETGTIAVSAYHRGNHVVINIEDDGAGINAEKVTEAAVARGLISREQATELSRREIYNLIFLPGVSTKERADEISGRGVVMDVVKTNIARLSGIIDVWSEPGHGTRISITLPITLAIIPALVIRVGTRTYAIPLNSVLESVLIDPRELKTIERREVYSLRGQTLPLLRLDEVFGIRARSSAGSAPSQMGQYIVVVGLAQHRIGLVADELTGQQDIVIKSLGRLLGGVPGIAGATELGGQQTVLVLDVGALVEEAVASSGSMTEAAL